MDRRKMAKRELLAKSTSVWVSGHPQFVEQSRSMCTRRKRSWLTQSANRSASRVAHRALRLFAALEVPKNIKSLKCLIPKSVFGQVFGAGARADFENPI